MGVQVRYYTILYNNLYYPKAQNSPKALYSMVLKGQFSEVWADQHEVRPPGPLPDVRDQGAAEVG